MKRKPFLILIIAALLVTLSFGSVFADETANETGAQEYEEVENYKTIITDAEIHIYKTQGAGTVEKSNGNASGTFPQLTGYRGYKATETEGWVFKNWIYRQEFRGNDLGNRSSGFGVKRYSFTSSSDDQSDPYRGGNKISVNRLVTAGEIAGLPILYKIYANFNPTITASASGNGTISEAGRREMAFGAAQSYEIKAAEGSVIRKILVDGQDTGLGHGAASQTYRFDKVTRPHTIQAVFGPKPAVINQTPSIKAEDKTIAFGTKFDPKEGVTAEDPEEGNLTASLEVTKNEVKTDKAGTYVVTYRVRDKKGATTVKSITVTVEARKEMPKAPMMAQPEADKEVKIIPLQAPAKPSVAAKVRKVGTPKTGDRAQFALYTAIGMLALAGIGVVAAVRKRRARG